TETADDSANLTALGGGHYRLTIGNTSGIGSINAFRWSPPNGLTITKLTSATGAKCTLQAGATSSTGSLAPPQCLRRSEGGVVTLNFTASGLKATTSNGHPVIQALSAGNVRVTEMTPVPYLIPQNLQELRNSRGI